MSIISQTSPVAYITMIHLAEIEKLKSQVVTLQASEAKLMDEASGEGGDDLVYENEKLKAENEKLKGRVDIMEKCKKVWYDKCQEDPDDDPDRNGIKWSICLEGGLNYWMNEAVRYESAYDFMSIIANEATGVFHFLGERADEETAERLIPTEYMEREEFQCFNPNWEDHHN